MEIKRARLEEAGRQGLISPEQVGRLWDFLGQDPPPRPRFNFINVLYYLGGLVAIGGMSIFMTVGFDRFGPWGMFTIALAYMALGVAGAEYLLHRRGLPVPAGQLAALVVVVAPLAVYGLELGLGWLPAKGLVFRHYHTHINQQWLVMELVTLVVGALVLLRYRLPFTLMPVAVTIWYISMDLAPWLFSRPDESWVLRKWLAMGFGLAMIGGGLVLDWRDREGRDYGFWLHLWGAISFWGGLTAMTSNNEWKRALYCAINLVLILGGALVGRRVFTVLGGLGLVGYLGHLAYSVFKDSLTFSLALTVLGLGVVAGAVAWHRREQRIGQYLRGLLPAGLGRAIEQRLE